VEDKEVEEYEPPEIFRAVYVARKGDVRVQFAPRGCQIAF